MNTLEEHLAVLCTETDKYEHEEAIATPIFTASVYEHIRDKIGSNGATKELQYGLLGGQSEVLEKHNTTEQNGKVKLTDDPRLFVNVSHPFSAFICGSQGSGKSHTLSCLLENCLISSKLNYLSNPLAALVFHYDTFISDEGGSPCEAAFLSSNPDVSVKVICSPTNITTIQRTYAELNVKIEPLYLKESDLNTKRMLDLMAIKKDDTSAPLYIHTIQRILREMRIMQQEEGTNFCYRTFKTNLTLSNLTSSQLAPLQQRLDVLESFMVPKAVRSSARRDKRKVARKRNKWRHEPGSLTVVDLSCPCVTPETACAIFNICLSIFLEQDITVGRVVALDEAHKYMSSSAESSVFTETLLSTIRLQRHLGTRILISTQEPTVSSKLIDLSSITIAHRFTSPEWFKTLRRHLAPVAVEMDSLTIEQPENAEEQSQKTGLITNASARDTFDSIVKLRVGEALVFSPNAMVASGSSSGGRPCIQRLGFGYILTKIRDRLTDDGGKSVMSLAYSNDGANGTCGARPWGLEH